jgi:hypothetical protein
MKGAFWSATLRVYAVSSVLVTLKLSIKLIME